MYLDLGSERVNPLTHGSDKFINSSYNNFFNTLSSRQVMRIKKIIKYFYFIQLGELASRSWE